MESIVLQEEPDTLDADILQEEEAEAKAEEERHRLVGSPYSRTGHGWTAEPPDTRSHGRAVSAGWALKPAWATTQEA
jgi:hypothetical protein